VRFRSVGETVKELRAYKNSFGDCAVPANYPQNPKLGIWVAHQRRLSTAGKMHPDRAKLLNEIEFIWGFRKGQGLIGVDNLGVVSSRCRKGQAERITPESV
jgi:Helicase associated domain